MAKDKDTDSLIDALTKPLSGELVKELEEKVAALEAEITERRNKIDTLLMLKKFDEVRKNGKSRGGRKKGEGKGDGQAKKAEETAPVTSPNSNERDSLVHRYLIRSGPRKSSEIAAACNIPMGSISSVTQRLVEKKLVVSVPEGWKAI